MPPHCMSPAMTYDTNCIFISSRTPGMQCIRPPVGTTLPLCCVPCFGRRASIACLFLHVIWPSPVPGGPGRHHLHMQGVCVWKDILTKHFDNGHVVACKLHAGMHKGITNSAAPAPCTPGKPACSISACVSISEPPA
eukprot:362579-Chlamydomonas_euryale.AAC.2